MVKLSPLEEVILVLAGIKSQLEPCLRTFKRYQHDQEAKTCLTNYLLVVVASFLQEWQRLEGLGAMPEVRRTLLAAAPATKRIREWRGINRLRSSMLAHGFRGKDGQLVNISELVGPGLAPTSFAGQMLVGELAVYAIATAICHHKSTNDSGLRKLLAVWPDEEPASCGIETMSEFHLEISAVRSEMFSIDPSLEACFGNSKNEA